MPWYLRDYKHVGYTCTTNPCHLAPTNDPLVIINANQAGEALVVLGGQYREVGRLVLTGPGRWPRLLELVHRHKMIFVTWATVLPGLSALALSVVQLIASRRKVPAPPWIAKA